MNLLLEGPPCVMAQGGCKGRWLQGVGCAVPGAPRECRNAGMRLPMHGAVFQTMVTGDCPAWAAMLSQKTCVHSPAFLNLLGLPFSSGWPRCGARCTPFCCCVDLQGFRAVSGWLNGKTSNWHHFCCRLYFFSKKCLQRLCRLCQQLYF